ncbi:GDP-mannose 4,6-dehydratase [Methylocystis sp. JR02]|uniref:GDP-mannose 4,6-dehydratase n=1 Tax=Methylocystis sp. JR02 TaxID=3046284 RepID=UPI0024BB72F7|nr:GDP-mannose 4,6-dehydratase [Methylocystis sp. JR02]MDJ0447119.1 GDP-mannose 4,6-dehydratase [Methylocystis sp. JR02]
MTGAGGFVGSHLAPALAAAYPDAERIALRRPGSRHEIAGWTSISCDLTDLAGVREAVRYARPDLVVHLAAQASMMRSIQGAEQTWRANFIGTLNLGYTLIEHAPHALFFFTSSATVYGASYRNGVVDEETPLLPIDAYSNAKLAAERALADILPDTARLVIARPVNHSGPGQDCRYFALPSFAAQIARIEQGLAEPRIKVGDLSKARDFLDVRDVVRAYMQLIETGSPPLEQIACFNVSSGEPHTMQSFLDLMRAQATTPFDVVVDPSLIRPSVTDVPVTACRSTRLREATGWSPRYSMADVTLSLLEHWRLETARSRSERRTTAD